MLKYKGFSKKELVDIYTKMFMSRSLDDKQLKLLKQGKGYFHIGATGHEAAELAAAKNINPKMDYSYLQQFLNSLFLQNHSPQPGHRTKLKILYNALNL